LGTPVSSTKKADRQNMTEILFKVALNTMTLALTPIKFILMFVLTKTMLKTLCFLPGSMLEITMIKFTSAKNIISKTTGSDERTLFLLTRTSK
jgi:hypothetical protein